MLAARLLFPFALIAGFAAPAHCAEPPKVDPMASFHAGTVITDFGKVVAVADSDLALPPETVFRVAFDVAKGEAGKLDRTLESAARSLNMHAEAGVPLSQQHLAVVVHGSAVFDVAGSAAYARKYPGATNPNPPLVAALLAKGVRIIVCGQSAAAQGLSRQDLLPGVELALSAMTAHALLQQQGYSLNPF